MSDSRTDQSSSTTSNLGFLGINFPEAYGGTEADFSGAPFKNTQSGTARFAAYQANTLIGPKGRLHVASTSGDITVDGY